MSAFDDDEFQFIPAETTYAVQGDRVFGGGAICGSCGGTHVPTVFLQLQVVHSGTPQEDVEHPELIELTAVITPEMAQEMGVDLLKGGIGMVLAPPQDIIEPSHVERQGGTDEPGS